MERLDVNSALLHISLLMEHRGGGEVWQKNGRWHKNIDCYFDKFCAWYWFPIPMSQIYQTTQKHQNIKEETSTMKKFSFCYQLPKAIKRTMKKLFTRSQAKIQYFQLKERPRQKCFFRNCAFLLPRLLPHRLLFCQLGKSSCCCQTVPKGTQIIFPQICLQLNFSHLSHRPSLFLHQLSPSQLNFSHQPSLLLHKSLFCHHHGGRGGEIAQNASQH